MRPINLTIKAFGPYANTQFLNFEDNLVDSNLFLIHGATGAGKTTILDAIVFALYGSKNFGNGRFVRNLLEQAEMKQAQRLFKESDGGKIDKEKLIHLSVEDFSGALSEVYRKNRSKIGFLQ